MKNWLVASAFATAPLVAVATMLEMESGDSNHSLRESRLQRRRHLIGCFVYKHWLGFIGGAKILLLLNIITTLQKNRYF
jgi:hypothetical protein